MKTNMNNNGWVKLHRQLKESSFYTRPHAVHLFVHLLLSVNNEDTKFFWNGEEVIVKAGEQIIGLLKLSKETGISIQSLRTALKVLKSTCTITSKSTNKYTLIGIPKWQDYQGGVTSTSTSKLTNNQQTTNKQLTTYKNNKNNKNIDTNVSIDEKIHHRQMIDFVLTKFYETYGATPTDRKPRNVAWALIQNVRTYKKLSGTEKTEIELFASAVTTFKKKFPEISPSNLDVVRRHAKSVMETRLLQIKSNNI